MDHAEAGKEIRRAVDTGKVLFGARESLYALKHGEGQLVVITSTSPPLSTEEMNHIAQLSTIPVYVFEGNGQELGSVCGKPFVISTLLVLDEGKSKVLQLGEKKAQVAEAQADAPKRARKKKGA